MLQLVYLSAATEIAPDVSELAEQSALRNAAEEITGVLMLSGGHYLQVLEGPKEVVEDAFLRIIGDPRHDQLNLLARSLVTARQFGSRSMLPVVTMEGQKKTIDRVRALLVNATHELRTLFELKFGSLPAAL